MQFQDSLIRLPNKNQLPHPRKIPFNNQEKQKSNQQNNITSNNNLSHHSFPSSSIQKRSMNQNRILYQNKQNKSRKNNFFSLKKFNKLRFLSLSSLSKKILERKFIIYKSIETNTLILLLIMAINSKLFQALKLLSSQVL